MQVGGRTFAATARTAPPGGRSRLWALMVAAMPSYRRYEETISREIPVVIVELYSGR